MSSFAGGCKNILKNKEFGDFVSFFLYYVAMKNRYQEIERLYVVVWKMNYFIVNFVWRHGDIDQSEIIAMPSHV